jgi:hypothetical protein
VTFACLLQKKRRKKRGKGKGDGSFGKWGWKSGMLRSMCSLISAEYRESSRLDQGNYVRKRCDALGKVWDKHKACVGCATKSRCDESTNGEGWNVAETSMERQVRSMERAVAEGEGGTSHCSSG